MSTQPVNKDTFLGYEGQYLDSVLVRMPQLASAMLMLLLVNDHTTPTRSVLRLQILREFVEQEDLSILRCPGVTTVPSENQIYRALQAAINNGCVAIGPKLSVNVSYYLTELGQAVCEKIVYDNPVDSDFEDE